MAPPQLLTSLHSSLLPLAANFSERVACACLSSPSPYSCPAWFTLPEVPLVSRYSSISFCDLRLYSCFLPTPKDAPSQSALQAFSIYQFLSCWFHLSPYISIKKIWSVLGHFKTCKLKSLWLWVTCKRWKMLAWVRCCVKEKEIVMKLGKFA